jgi:hypothetical protein
MIIFFLIKKKFNLSLLFFFFNLVFFNLYLLFDLYTSLTLLINTNLQLNNGLSIIHPFFVYILYFTILSSFLNKKLSFFKLKIKIVTFIIILTALILGSF